MDNPSQSSVKAKAARNALMGSIVVGLLYSIVVQALDGKETAILTLSVGIIIAFITGMTVLLIELRYELSDTQALSGVISKYHQEVHTGLDVGKDLVRWLASDEYLARRTYTSLAKCEKPIREIGERTLKDHLARFDTIKRGFAVEGEAISLDAYARSWEKLIELQTELNANEICSDRTRLIVRATHSNDIGLWLPRINPRAHELLNQQRIFVSLGGVVVRLLLCKDFEKPTDEYDEAVKLMEEIGVEARFLHTVYESQFDFMWVDPLGLVSKWFSGSHGKMLASCEISEHPDNVYLVRRRWETLGGQSELLNGKFTKIPAERRI